MTHRVSARRQGDGAVLQCKACKAERAVGAWHFDAFNDFLREHLRCRDTPT